MECTVAEWGVSFMSMSMSMSMSIYVYCSTAAKTFHKQQIGVIQKKKSLFSVFFSKISTLLKHLCLRLMFPFKEDIQIVIMHNNI